MHRRQRRYGVRYSHARNTANIADAELGEMPQARWGVRNVQNAWNVLKKHMPTPFEK